MAGASRTLNPLHFEDLEPKRFEDLIRQLAYDFKNWRRLEATGRAGSDDGFDARGYEQLGPSLSVSLEEEDADEVAESEDRLWLIQCKREKTITPAKMRAHLSAIRVEEPLYGVIFAAPCDFSKATRDVLADWCRAKGISEWHLWGRAELEDLLLQPKNDGILFAYFGISLAIRRRSTVSEIRRQIGIKRKLAKLLDSRHNMPMLIRDIDDEQYPYLSEDGTPPHWRVRAVREVTAVGLSVRVSMREAWISEDGAGWDAALDSTGMALDNGEDHWHEPDSQSEQSSQLAREAWSRHPDSEKAWLYSDGIIPYSQIVLIDDVGDDLFRGPHIYVTGWNVGYPLGRQWVESMQVPKRELEINGPDTPGRLRKYPEGVRHRRKMPEGF